MNKTPHLLIALSSHGFGHLSQAAPVINQLRVLMPELRVTVRGKFPDEQIKRRIHAPDTIEQVADDFGMVMHHALSVDAEASRQAYRGAHQNWDTKVANLAAHLKEIEVDLVLSDIPYLTLAAAQQAGIPSVALCSLNWADILEYYLHDESALIDTIRSAYQSAKYFLQPAPSMQMPALTNTMTIGPVCSPGINRRPALSVNLGLPEHAWVILVGMGGMAYPVTLDHWPSEINDAPVYYLVPDEMLVIPSERSDPSRIAQARSLSDRSPVNTISIEQTGLTYSSLVASVDLIITKPGYGMFVEAAAAGVPVLYVDRPGWPETAALTDWLRSVAYCTEISADILQQGLFKEPLTTLLTQGHYPPVPTSGNLQAAQILQRILTHTE